MNLSMRHSLSIFLLCALSAVAFAQTAKHTAKGPNPDEPAIHDCVLTMDNVAKYAEVSKKVAAAAIADPAMAAEMQKIQDANVYNVEKAAMLEKSPHSIAFLKSNGMTAHDFVMIPMTLFTASMAIAVEDGKGKAPAFVNPANIQFVREHKSELENLKVFGSDKEKNQDSDEKDSSDDKN